MSDAEESGDLAAADEILQVIFWLEGEGLASSVDPASIARFVPLAEREIVRLLRRLTARGLLNEDADARYVFTPAGRHEAARRFADEFADMTKPGHGVCGDPDCECHQTQ
jgi:DNA-binding IclR family transcriptional regulator